MKVEKDEKVGEEEEEEKDFRNTSITFVTSFKYGLSKKQCSCFHFDKKKT